MWIDRWNKKRVLIAADVCYALAFASALGSLITRQGGPQVLHGSALAFTATIRAWSNDTGTPVPELARTAIR